MSNFIPSQSEKKPAPEVLDVAIKEHAKWLEYDKTHPVDMSSRLLVVPPYDERESLLGYLLRLSEANYHHLNTAIIRPALINDEEMSAHHCDLIATGRFDIPGLARLLGVGTADVFNMTYAVVKQLTMKSRGSVVMDYYEYPFEMIRVRKPRLCVECFKEAKSDPSKTPIHRRIWDIAHYTVCTRHYTLLDDVCPSCNRQLTWVREKLTECRCGFDLCQIKPVKVPIDHAALSARVAISLQNEEDPDDELTDDLEMGYFWELSQYHAPDEFSPSQGYQDYPTDITDEIYERERQHHDYKRKSVGFSYGVMPNEMLHRHLISLYPELFGDRPVSYRKDNYPVTSLTQTADTLGISRTSLDKIMEVFPPTNGVHYDKADLTYLSELYHKLLPTSKACEILGTTGYLLSKLSALNIINPTLGPHINGYGDNLYDVDDVTTLLKRLNSKVTKPTGKETLVPLASYTDMQVRHRWPYADLINKILNNELKIYGFDMSSGLPSIVIDDDDLHALNTQDQVDASMLTVDDVAKLLSLYTNAIYRTIEAGLLKQRREKVNKAILSFISAEDFEQFQNQYVFVNEIAKAHQINPTNLAEKIKDEGLKPVSGPGVDNNLVYIFKRDEVDRLDMETVIQKKGYQTKAGRPKKGTPSKWDDHPPLIDATAIANHLGTTVQRVSALARKGYLKAYQHNGELGNKRFFELSEYEAYLKRFRENPDLASFDEALAMLDEDELQFKSNWVRSGRISFIEDGLKGRYFDREELEALREFKQYAISTRDAAAQLGVNRNVIQNKASLGYLYPISGPGIDEFKNYFYEKDDIRGLFRSQTLH